LPNATLGTTVGGALEQHRAEQARDRLLLRQVDELPTSRALPFEIAASVASAPMWPLARSEYE
jgi:hypothetical protein